MCFLLIRYVLVFKRYHDFFEKNIRTPNSDDYYFILTMGSFDVFLTYFFPIGTDDDSRGRFDANDRNAVILAITGPLQKATVKDKLMSQPAIRLLGIHILEILVGWVVVLSIGADSSHADVSLWYALCWGVAPVACSMIAYFGISSMGHKGADGTGGTGVVAAICCGSAAVAANSTVHPTTGTATADMLPNF